MKGLTIFVIVPIQRICSCKVLTLNWLCITSHLCRRLGNSLLIKIIYSFLNRRINIITLSSSLSHTDSMDFPDSLLPSVPIIHRSSFKTSSSICTELMHISLYWSANTGTSMCRSPSGNITNEFILTYPAVSHMSCSSY